MRSHCRNTYCITKCVWFAQVLLNVVLIDLVYCKSYNNSTPSAQLAKRALLPAPLSDLRARAGRRHRWLGERRCPGEDRLDLGHDDAGGRLGVFFNLCRRRWTLTWRTRWRRRGSGRLSWGATQVKRYTYISTTSPCFSWQSNKTYSIKSGLTTNLNWS